MRMGTKGATAIAVAAAIMLFATPGDGAAWAGDAGPRIGFNCKGTLNTFEQLDMLRAELRTRRDADRLVLRVDGGTSSQRNYPADWTDAMIEAWVSIQEEFGCRFIMNLNFNDTPQSQYALFQRWKAAGAVFWLIELMNEPYLPRYRRAHDDPQNVASGFVEVTPVTEFMTPEKYVNLATGFVTAFRNEGIPFAAALAPEKDGNQGLIYAAWNDAVIEELKKHADIHATLHLYQRVGESLDLEQIDRIKERIAPRRLYVTEAGVLGNEIESSYEDFIQAEVALLTAIMARLAPEDLLQSQVLYNNYKSTFEASFHPSFGGITPKGTAIFSLFGVPKRPPDAPVITTDGGNGPGADFLTNQTTVTLQGTCSSGVTQIRVNGSAGGVTYTAGQTAWLYTGPLAEGVNSFSVVAVDAAAIASEPDAITVTRDTVRPRVTGAFARTPHHVRVSFDKNMADTGLTTPGSYAFGSGSGAAIAPTQVARVTSSAVEVTVNEMTDGAPYLLTVEVSGPRDLAGNRVSAAANTATFLGVGEPPAAPTITTNDGRDFATESTRVNLAGVCAADTAKILVNGLTSRVLYAAGKTSWSYSGPIAVGPNVFEVTAVDSALNASAPATIVVTRDLPPPITPGVGDIDGNGHANSLDVQHVILAVLGFDIPYDCDVNGDGRVDALDLQLVIRIVLG